MTAPALTRRRTQITLLAEACRRRQPARLSSARRSGGRGGALAIRFLALEPDAVLLQWPAQGTGAIEVRDAAVEVRFQHGGRAFGFRSTTRGRVAYTRGGGGMVGAWKLDLPLCVEPRAARQHVRVMGGEAVALDLRCTSVTNLGHSFTGRLHDLSTGGMRIRAGQPEAAWAQAGEVMWISSALPDRSGQVEFVARVQHVRHCPTDNSVLLGCRFCPRDDSTAHDGQLAQLRALLVRAPRRPQGGSRCS